MSGERPNYNCRIGKITPKKGGATLRIIEPHTTADGPVRELFHNSLKVIDDVVDEYGQGHQPLAGFFGLVWADGSVDIRYANKDDDAEAPYVNWRHLVMCMEDFVADLRNYTIYDQATPYTLFFNPDEAEL